MTLASENVLFDCVFLKVKNPIILHFLKGSKNQFSEQIHNSNCEIDELRLHCQTCENKIGKNKSSNGQLVGFRRVSNVNQKNGKCLI